MGLLQQSLCRHLIYLLHIFESKAITSLYYFGMEIISELNRITIGQIAYMRQLLEKLNMVDATNVSITIKNGTYHCTVDTNGVSISRTSWFYFPMGTRLDIAFALCYLGRFLDNYKKRKLLQQSGFLNIYLAQLNVVHAIENQVRRLD